MKEVILRKLHREAQERVATMHFRYPTRLGGGVSHYTTIEMTEDDDVEVLFGIYDSIELQTRPELYVTFQRFASSSTQSQPTSLPSFHYEQSEVPPSSDHQSQLLSHQTPHPLTFDLNEPIHQHLGDWEDQIQSYTELLSGSYINLDEYQNQQHLQEPPQEHWVVGLPNEVFDPFSEDEDDILAAANDHEGEDLHVQRQTMNHMNITHLMSHLSTFYTFQLNHLYMTQNLVMPLTVTQ